MGKDKIGGTEASLSEAGETTLRGAVLDGPEQKNSVDHVTSQKARNTDATLRLDDEPDTLYEDGLEIEDASRPLTGINGRDDTQ
jgi:hypothetical protein